MDIGFYIYLTISLFLILLGSLTIKNNKKDILKVKALRDFRTGKNSTNLAIIKGEIYEVSQISKDGFKYILKLPNGVNFGWTNKKDYKIINEKY